VLSGRGICDELITRPGESYRLWCVVVCGLETSRMRRPWPALGRSATAKKMLVDPQLCLFITPLNSAKNMATLWHAHCQVTIRPRPGHGLRLYSKQQWVSLSRDSQ